MLKDAPKRFFFLRTRDLLVSQKKKKKKTTQRHLFSTLHPLSTVHFATATVLAFVLLRDSRFNFHCEAYSEISPEVRCDLPRLLARKITKCIHSSKPASLNRPLIKEEVSAGFLLSLEGPKPVEVSRSSTTIPTWPESSWENNN